MKIQLPTGKDQIQIFNIKMIIFGTWGPLLISDFNDLVLLENPGGFAKVVHLQTRKLNIIFLLKLQRYQIRNARFQLRTSNR